MGLYWAHDVPAKLEGAGLRVVRYPGWELRSRSTGGFDDVLAVGIHHDAWPAGRSIETRLAYAWQHSESRPVGNMWIHTDGVIYFGAAGASNTQGRMNPDDEPIRVSKGVIDSRSIEVGGKGTSFGNRNMFSIEMSNDGVGEVWTAAQLETLETTLAVLCAEFGLDPLTDIISHHRYTDRKVDPRGQTPARPSWGGVSGLNMWDDRAVSKDVASSTSPEEDSVKVADVRRLYDSRVPSKWSGEPAQRGQVVTLDPKWPAQANWAHMRLTTVNQDGPGYAVVYSGDKPAVSNHNWSSPGAQGDAMLIPLSDDGKIRIVFDGSKFKSTHFIVDLTAWET